MSKSYLEYQRDNVNNSKNENEKEFMNIKIKNIQDFYRKDEFEIFELIYKDILSNKDEIMDIQRNSAYYNDLRENSNIWMLRYFG